MSLHPSKILGFGFFFSRLEKSLCTFDGNPVNFMPMIITWEATDEQKTQMSFFTTCHVLAGLQFPLNPAVWRNQCQSITEVGVCVCVSKPFLPSVTRLWWYAIQS